MDGEVLCTKETRGRDELDRNKGANVRKSLLLFTENGPFYPINNKGPVNNFRHLWYLHVGKVFLVSRRGSSVGIERTH